MQTTPLKPPPDRTQVGINGFGRIGRLSFRGVWDMPELEIVRPYDPKTLNPEP